MVYIYKNTLKVPLNRNKIQVNAIYKFVKF